MPRSIGARGAWAVGIAGLLAGACATPQIAVAGGRVVVGGHYRYGGRCVTVTARRGEYAHYRWSAGNASGSGTTPAADLGAACTLPKQPPLRRGPLTAAEAKALVAAHGALRAKYKVAGLRWSPTIAAYAQSWAERLAKQKRCGLEHRRTHRYGENLAMWGGQNALRRPPETAVAQWASEFRVWNRSRIFSEASMPAGHLTQVLWRGSKELGCGRGTCGDNAVVVVCNYGPAGNVLGQPIY